MTTKRMTPGSSAPMGAIYTDRMDEEVMSEITAEIRRRFDERANEYDGSAMHQALAVAVAAFANRGAGTAEIATTATTTTTTVLDVGTGTGLVLRALHASGIGEERMTGIDLSPGMLAVARAALPGATFIEGDAQRLPLPDASMDLVTCVTVLHLIPDAAAAAAEWARVLRAGGRLVAATFAAMDPAQHGAAHPAPHSHHEDFSTPERLERVLASAGFALRRHEYWTHGADRVILAEFTKP